LNTKRPGELPRAPGLLFIESGADREARKYFFFEKKKQKTFACWLTRRARSTRTEASKSFLILFFKKELLSWRLPSCGGEWP
jgi:hypothetical protein